MDGFHASLFTPAMLDYLRVHDPMQYEHCMRMLSMSISNTPPPNVARGLFQNSPEGFVSPPSQTQGMYSPNAVEFVAETQPTIQPKAKGRKKGKEATTGEATTPNAQPRNVQWSEKEDVILIRCYMDACTCSIIGTNQKYATLFKKVHEMYEASRKDALFTGVISRTADSLRKRMHRIKTEISHWLVSYERAVSAVGQRSGFNEDNVKETAQEFHKEKYHNGFSMWSQWEALKKYPEYELYLDWESQLKKRQDQSRDHVDLADDGSERMETTDGSSGTKRYRLVDDSVSSPKRPMGRDKAKRMSKGGSSTNTSMDVISEGWVQFNDNFPQHLELERQRMQWEQECLNSKLEFEREKVAKKEAMKLKELGLKEQALKNERMGYMMQLLNNYNNLTDQQRALADQLAAEFLPKN